MDNSTQANRIISNILRYGSYLSILFMILGLVLFVLQGSSTGQELREIPTQTVLEALGGLFGLDPIAFMTVGIIALLVTPFLRVLGLFVIYLFVEKDKLYAMISFGVLVILIISMLIPGLK